MHMTSVNPPRKVEQTSNKRKMNPKKYRGHETGSLFVSSHQMNSECVVWTPRGSSIRPKNPVMWSNSRKNGVPISADCKAPITNIASNIMQDRPQHRSVLWLDVRAHPVQE